MLKVVTIAVIALPTIVWAQTYDELQSYLEQQQAGIEQNGLDRQQAQTQEDTNREQRWVGRDRPPIASLRTRDERLKTGSAAR